MTRAHHAGAEHRARPRPDHDRGSASTRHRGADWNVGPRDEALQAALGHVPAARPGRLRNFLRPCRVCRRRAIAPRRASTIGCRAEARPRRRIERATGAPSGARRPILPGSRNRGLLRFSARPSLRRAEGPSRRIGGPLTGISIDPGADSVAATVCLMLGRSRPEIAIVLPLPACLMRQDLEGRVGMKPLQGLALIAAFVAAIVLRKSERGRHRERDQRRHQRDLAELR